MKALPLYQPWASLVACGAKRIETRHWATPRTVLGERIAIYATKTLMRGGKREERRLLDWPVFAQALRHPLGLEPFADADELAAALPRGFVLASVVVARCTEITEARAARLERDHPAEHAFGDYTPGRYAWVLEDLRALEDPIECKPPEGFRGGFFTVPENIAAQLGGESWQGALL